MELKAKKIYLSNKELYKEIIISQAKGKLTTEAQRMLILLGKNIIRRFYYQNPDDRLDCLQNGYMQVFKAWQTFDTGKSDNAFSYMTEVFKRGAAKGWNELHKDDGKLVPLEGLNMDGETFERF